MSISLQVINGTEYASVHFINFKEKYVELVIKKVIAKFYLLSLVVCCVLQKILSDKIKMY